MIVILGHSSIVECKYSSLAVDTAAASSVHAESKKSLGIKMKTSNNKIARDRVQSLNSGRRRKKSWVARISICEVMVKVLCVCVRFGTGFVDPTPREEVLGVGSARPLHWGTRKSVLSWLE